MTITPQQDQDRRAPYASPTLRRLGNAAELTQNRSPQGGKDGGPNNTRSQ